MFLRAPGIDICFTSDCQGRACWVSVCSAQPQRLGLVPEDGPQGPPLCMTKDGSPHLDLLLKKRSLGEGQWEVKSESAKASASSQRSGNLRSPRLLCN